MFHANEWLDVRATYDQAKRTAEGETIYGFQADEAERETKRTILNVEVTPTSTVGLIFAYQRRDVDYPNRPDRIQVTGGVPAPGAQPIPGTPSGLLEANYESYTGEIDFNPNERVELSAFYTYEKDTSINQWSTTTAGAINNLLNYAGSDETDTFGVNGVFQFVPDKWTCTLLVQQQKVDGLMDVTANPSGAFYTSRATVGGPQPITDYDDTKLTTVTAKLDYMLAKAWKIGVGLLVREVRVQGRLHEWRPAHAAVRPDLHEGRRRGLQGERGVRDVELHVLARQDRGPAGACRRAPAIPPRGAALERRTAGAEMCRPLFCTGGGARGHRGRRPNGAARRR